MAAVEVRDETVIVVARGEVARVLTQRRRWRSWWPSAVATVVTDRGLDGMRWSLRGEVVGVTDVSLIDDGDAVRVRYVLSVDPTLPGSPTTARTLPGSPHGEREIDALRRRQQVAWKRAIWALKEELEASAGRGGRSAR